MFAHRSCVVQFTKITLFPYSEQVQDIELYGTSVGDDYDAKWTNSSIQKNFFWTFGTLNTTEQVLKMTLMLKWNNSNISNFSIKFWYIKHYSARVGDDFVAKKNKKTWMYQWLFKV